MSRSLIGVRIRARRKQLGLSQVDLAGMFGFQDRQTVSAIETGARRITADELILAVERLGVPLDYFTDPFRLVGEGSFSWRQSGVGAERLQQQEHEAGCWIAAFRALAPRVGREIPLMRRALGGLTRRSSFEDAMQAGERFAAYFGLDEAPATRLPGVMEQDLGILVLMVDTHDGVSGAACRLPELDTVLVARHEIAGRRHFGLAHELFHILTWDAMPPGYVREARETGGNRVEQLANNFAAAVLMPTTTLERFADWDSLGQWELIARLNRVADELRVTAVALKWRLAALGALRPATARSVSDGALRDNGHDDPQKNVRPPTPFSKPFAEVMSLAIDRGYVSTRRMAGLLGLTVDDLAELFAAHGVGCPVAL